jgi:Cdc6-like AAA superfamily ATPase
MNLKITENQEKFSLLDTPEKLLFRENEYSQLVTNIKNSANTLVHGPLGSGKTTLLRRASQELSTVSAKVVFIDCSLYQTANAVLRELLIDRPIASRSNYDLLKRLIERARNNKPTICLDHIENLKEKEVIGQLMQIGLCVVIACNGAECISSLDLRARVGIASVLELKPYTEEQTFRILKKVTDEVPGAKDISDEILSTIAAKTRGNITLALNILKTMVFKSQAQGKDILEDINSILIEHDYSGKLNHDEKLLMQVLREWKSLPASRLYDFYVQRSKHPKSERAFRNYMSDLASKGLAKSIGEKRGRVYEIIEKQS